MLSNDSRPICQITIDADYQTAHTVGRYGVTKISAFDEVGEMAHVPWFEVWKGDALYCRVNAKYVSEVLYQEGQPMTTTNEPAASEHEHYYVTACFYCGHIVAHVNPPASVTAEAVAAQPWTKHDAHCDCGICAYCNGQEDVYGNPRIPAASQPEVQADAGEQMREACIEQVKKMRDTWTSEDADFVWIETANQIITALESLTITE